MGTLFLTEDRRSQQRPLLALEDHKLREVAGAGLARLEPGRVRLCVSVGARGALYGSERRAQRTHTCLLAFE